MKTERQLQNYIINRIRVLGGLCHKMESRSSRGWPDLICIYNGRCAFVEVKTPAGTGKLSALQKRCLEKLLIHKMDAFLVDTQELADELIDWLVG